MYRKNEKHELIGMVDLAAHRKLSAIELKTIHNTILKLLNTNCDMETSENLRRTIFVLENYYQVKEAKKLLLICLHICKLELTDNPHVLSKLDQCLQIIGDFSATKELKYIWTTIIFLSKRYLQETNNNVVTDAHLLTLINNSTTSLVFSNTKFYMLLYQHFYKSQDALALNKLNKLSSILKTESTMVNYLSFIKWVNA